MTTASTSKHWRRAIDGGVCWLTLDKAGSAANTLSSEVLEELSVELDALRYAEEHAVRYEAVGPGAERRRAEAVVTRFLRTPPP